eukprot:9667674-Alexandrium_andersonii.AAC.1
MSASLVGSEMCIRDRQEDEARERAIGRCKRTRQENDARGRGKRTSKGPVSYTHLTLPTICSV